ncbi:MAG TPA: GTPase HflX, partial [Acholeplasma sp.]|nr:GTPase HflX [Acholeplasma sp.]
MDLKKDLAILVGLELINSKYKMKDSLDELKHLASAVDIDTADIVIQRAERINSRFYVGKGKVDEIKTLVDVYEASMVIFDDPLSPAQINNLENALDVQVIDRSFLILSIFSERAQTRQSMLEVSLAQKEYMLPRLVGMGKSLSRQGGGTYNAKGPGETKLEMDRRRLLKDISNIKNELKALSKEHDISRKKRLESSIPVVALVGYTNVGKSSLMNSLSIILNNETPSVFEKD